MVDVADKPETPRTAVSRAQVRMRPETLARILAGGVGKGDVLGVARLAGIQAVKQTAALVPLCHPVRVTFVEVDLEADEALPGLVVHARVGAVDRTGPEMEALTAATVAGLTVYDMCKAMDRELTIERVVLVSKSGGKSGDWRRGPEG